MSIIFACRLVQDDDALNVWRGIDAVVPDLQGMAAVFGSKMSM